MYTILVVDDELLVREGIKNSINWEKNGFNKPLEAYNGREAWEIIESSKIDVVLTDIKMPDMNGIELVKKIRSSSRLMEVVILSCYNDFIYVKEALKLGACDYLFKLDMLPDDILKAIRKAVERIESREQLDNRIKSLEEAVAGSATSAKEDFIIDIINGRKINIEEFVKKAAEFDIKFSPEKLVLIIIKIDNIDEIIQTSFQSDGYLIKYSILNMLIEIMGEYEKSEVICKNKDEYLLIVSDAGNNSGKKVFERYSEISMKVITSLGKYLSLKATAGVSRCLRNIESLRIAYEEAACSIDKRYFIGTGCVIFYEDSVQWKDSTNIEISSLLCEISTADDEEDYEQKIRHIFDKLNTQKIANIKDIVEISGNIIGVLLKSVMKYDFIMEEIYKKEPQIYSKLYKFNTISEIESFICRVAAEIEELIEKRYRNEINIAIKYMEKNLGNQDTSLEAVARHVNMSKNYFSRIFKKATGESFIDYLVKMKVKKAEYLYRTTSLKIYQIAEKVGYPDWRYFCKVYKKCTGNKLTSLKK